MTNARALARVHKDLVAGHPTAAIRRLRTMLATDPDDWAVYRLLADVCRGLGDPAEAGRWGFLTDNVTSEEIYAFEMTHPQSWIRLQLLGWSGDPARIPSNQGRARYIALRKDVAEATIPTQRRPGSPYTASVPQGVSIPTQRRPLDYDRDNAGSLRPSFIGSLPIDRGSGDTAGAPVSSNKRTKKRRPIVETLRTCAMLMLLILGGSAGSVIAVGGIRALFGVKNWSAPIQALLSEIVRVLTG